MSEKLLLQQIIERIERLERTIFSREKKITKGVRETFAGPSGGARLLVSEGFFKTKRSLSDVRSALVKRDYHYSAAAIQTALNRLSARAGPLAAFREGGKKLYVRRK